MSARGERRPASEAKRFLFAMTHTSEKNGVKRWQGAPRRVRRCRGTTTRDEAGLLFRPAGKHASMATERRRARGGRSKLVATYGNRTRLAPETTGPRPRRVTRQERSRGR